MLSIYYSTVDIKNVKSYFLNKKGPRFARASRLKDFGNLLPFSRKAKGVIATILNQADVEEIIEDRL